MLSNDSQVEEQEQKENSRNMILTSYQDADPVLAASNNQFDRTATSNSDKSNQNVTDMIPPNNDNEEYTYHGEIVNGQFHGKGTLYLDNQIIYQGEFANGQFDGKGSFYWDSGEHYSGHWKKNRRNGIGTYYDTRGNCYTGMWKNDKRNGRGSVHSNSGKVCIGYWHNNNQVGKSLLYFIDSLYCASNHKEDTKSPTRSNITIPPHHSEATQYHDHITNEVLAARDATKEKFLTSQVNHYKTVFYTSYRKLINDIYSDLAQLAEEKSYQLAKEDYDNFDTILYDCFGTPRIAHSDNIFKKKFNQIVAARDNIITNINNQSVINDMKKYINKKALLSLVLTAKYKKINLNSIINHLHLDTTAYYNTMRTCYKTIKYLYLIKELQQAENEIKRRACIKMAPNNQNKVNLPSQIGISNDHNDDYYGEKKNYLSTSSGALFSEKKSRHKKKQPIQPHTSMAIKPTIGK